MNGTDTVLDWRSLHIGPGGRSLIEASAGTGKTWTIAALYLRLLLEQGLGPRQIVVSTFTKAAASELRERLHARLIMGEAWAAGWVAPDAADAVAMWLVQRWERDAPRREADLARLRLALAEFDQAPIGTLHALCARILREHPFASGGGFEQGELIEGRSVMHELANDLRRALTQSQPEALDAWLPPQLASQLAAVPGLAEVQMLLKPGVEIRSEAPPALPPDAAAILREGARPGMFQARSKIARAWNNAAEVIDSEGVVALDPDTLEEMRMASGLKAVSKDGKEDPAVLRAQAASPGIAEVLRARRDALRMQLWQCLRDWLLQRKQALMQRRDQRSFDDLLLQVRHVLESERGTSRPLADALAAAWPAALVDEFQDTDRVQYGILDAIYRSENGAPRGRLVMIGDPKQAIYGFRGGDVHAYLHAAQGVDEDARLQLAMNQRSSAHYVQAVNEWFRAAGNALDAGGEAASGIDYVEVTASTRRAGQAYRHAGEAVTRPLVFHHHPSPAKGAAARVEEALDACANDIAAMLASGAHRFGDAPLKPADIAVLLPTGAQVCRMRRKLEARGVRCVTTVSSSVFIGEIARELHLLLHATWHADQPALLRAAMATQLYGGSLDGVRALDHDAEAWQRHSARFHAWKADWQRRGVLAVIEGLMTFRGPALLAMEDGERILTDLRHIGETLQTESEAGQGAAELLSWFSSQRGGGADDEEEATENRRVRIESEAPRVKLMTLHASKGLEFPVVFLPLMWAHRGRKLGGLLAVSDTDAGRQLRADDAGARIAEREAQSERFRVLYVALTRAIHACHVYALPVDRPIDGKAGAPKARDAGSEASALDLLIDRLPFQADAERLHAELPHVEWREGWNFGAMTHYRGPATDLPALRARSLPPPLPQPLPSKHSFSTLLRGLSVGYGSTEDAAADEIATLQDEDASQLHVGEEEAEHPLIAALAGVRGTGIGNALHAFFEQRRHDLPATAQTGLLKQLMLAEDAWPEDAAAEALLQAWSQRLQDALQTPLAGDMPALAALPETRQRAEMEFHFALAPTGLRQLREACEAHGEAGLVPPGERRIAGLMTGKIDLLFEHDGRFHVLDYKGNFLGHRLSDYRGAALARAMADANYRFQALLYTVAVDRYLRQRVRGYARARHLGDAWYLFVRAAGLAPDVGIWRHRFSDTLLDAVGAAFPAPVVEVAP